MNAKNVTTGCVPCKCETSCKIPKNFQFVALDFKGNIVVISDYVEYPNVEVDMEDRQITFDEPNVTYFTKPDINLIYTHGIHEITG